MDSMSYHPLDLKQCMVSIQGNGARFIRGMNKNKDVLGVVLAELRIEL